MAAGISKEAVPMTDRERFVNCVLGREVDRPPFWLFWSPWGRAWQRWEREGKPPEVTDFPRSPTTGASCRPTPCPTPCR